MSGLRLLIVDDEKDVAEFLAQEFQDRGYEVGLALNGREALDQIRLNRPHVMLLDVRMPGLSGIETLQRAKEIDPGLGVIMVTAVQDDETMQLAMEFGAYDYITKPIDVEHLSATVMAKLIQMLD
jgi:DNA-binding response OmpR family regulator